MRNKTILALVVMIALCGQVLASNQITGVSWFNASGWYGPFTPQSCIDGTGMDIGGVADTAQTNGGYWYDPSGANWITVDLGGVGSLDEIKIWNINVAGASATYGWRFADVYVSLTNRAFDDPTKYQYIGEIDIPVAPGDNVAAKVLELLELLCKLRDEFCYARPLLLKKYGVVIAPGSDHLYLAL
jgi:hypothetical protein